MGIIDKVSSLLPTRSEQLREGDHDRGRDRERVAPQTQALALKDDFDRWLLRFFEEPWGYPIEYPGPGVPDVRDTDREFVVCAEAPGFDKDDIDLSVLPGQLVIKAARHEDGRDLRMTQTASLPRDVDVDRAEARLEGGVLTVRFPRTHPASRGRRIPVSTGPRNSPTGERRMT